MAKPRFEPLIEFVHSNERHVSPRDWSRRAKMRDRYKPLHGEDVRGFYEALISETTASAPQTSSEKAKRGKMCNSKSKLTNAKSHSEANGDSWETSDDQCNVRETPSVSHVQNTSTSNISRDDHKKMRQLEMQLLHRSQEGDLQSVEKAVISGADVNVQDLYGWTPLMCSAYAGHVGVVQTLLGLGADWDLCERKGRTARDLASTVGHGSIVKLIDATIAHVQSSNDGSTSNQQVTNEESFFCEICKRHFSEGTELSHRTSTVHLFNCQLKPKHTSYLISESNIGYQMMLRSGWNADRGLGPQEEGQKYPVKTVLKRNREGLGGERKSTPRVTHFPPRDVRAVATVKPRGERRESLRSQSRRAIKRKERKDKEWERNLRCYMNSD